MAMVVIYGGEYNIIYIVCMDIYEGVNHCDSPLENILGKLHIYIEWCGIKYQIAQSKT